MLMTGSSVVHGPARLRAAPADIGAFPAVLIVMPAAFFRAGFTGIRADHAKSCGMTAAEAHELGAGVAKPGAFHIELNAARHMRHIRFLRAGTGAMIANGGALQAEIDAFPEFMISGHKIAYLVVYQHSTKRIPYCIDGKCLLS